MYTTGQRPLGAVGSGDVLSLPSNEGGIKVAAVASLRGPTYDTSHEIRL